jgi:uncharacterized membrane protein YeiH
MTLTAPTYWLDLLRLIVEVLGTAAFALSGVLEGARKRLDPVGVCAVGFLAAFGGGTLRDLLLDRRPFFWVLHVEMLWGVFGLCLVAMLMLRGQHHAPTERVILWPDALGLGLFTASGVQLALDADLPGLVAVLMGVVTGVFGGVLRDIVCNEIPTVFRDQRPYAVCAFAGGWVCLALDTLGWPEWGVIMATLLVTAGSRLLAVHRAWRLPAWRV